MTMVEITLDQHLVGSKGAKILASANNFPVLAEDDVLAFFRSRTSRDL
jgi:hypothetical protein